MEAISLDQSATVDELVEACIHAFGQSVSLFVHEHSNIHATYSMSKKTTYTLCAIRITFPGTDCKEKKINNILFPICPCTT
jgi:hypothetical protein